MKIPNSSISIIIPTVDGTSSRYLACMESIDRHCSPAAAGFPEIITAQFGGTFAENCNEGVRHATGDYLLLLNDDAILTSDILTPLLYIASHGPAIIGARLLYPNGLIQHAGVGFDQAGGPYNLWHNSPAEHPEAMKARYLPAVTFACAFMPKDLWTELGGLDEGFVNSYEDVDFCIRARERGYNVRYEPTISAIHLAGQTPGRNDGVEASWRRFQEKWVATGRLWYCLGVWPFSTERK